LIRGSGRQVSSNNKVGVYCLFTGCDDLSTCRSTAVSVRTIQMRALPFQRLLILATILGLAAVSHAASAEPNRAPDAGRADPCSTSGAKTASPSPAPWRARISRRDAIYVILHMQKACRYLAESHDSRSASSVPQLASILDDLQKAVLDPIYRSHLDLKGVVLPVSPAQKVPRATRRDIQRTTATRMSDDLTRLRRQIYELSTQNLDQLPNKSAAEKALQPFNDAAAELTFAQSIAFDAYPDLFTKLAIPQQPRTEESDAGFRQSAPPPGSVRLSDSALALVKSFMREVRRKVPESGQIASIGWARDQRAKGPKDADWADLGSGWVLGTYRRAEVPPDVIDRVRDIEIIFNAEDPSSLAGKIVDTKDRKLVVHD
jgi:hypothetical protein